MSVSHSLRFVRLGVVAVAAAMVAVGVESSDVARSAVGANPRVVPASAAGRGSGALAGVAAVSPRLAWAVGGTGPGHPLIERWNGVSWHRVRLVGPRGGLFGVSAVSPSVAWAVGSRGLGACCSKPLALRWNGRTWTRVPTPRLGGQHAALDGVSAVSATDAWAVGTIYGDVGTEGVIEHWNGTRWQTTLIDRTAGSFLTAVTARGRRFAWAVGSAGLRLLTLAWHGSAWRQVPARSRCAPDFCLLTSVAVVSRWLGWAVGGRSLGLTDSFRPVIMRWNGSAWKAVPSPRGGGLLGSVVALSPRSAFAGSINSIRKSRPTIERWLGRTWRLDQ